MSLPAPWKPAGSDPQIESGQAWIHHVVRPDDSNQYALKLLKNLKRRERFVREVTAMRSLVDAGLSVIPPIMQAELDDERPWFVMPWYERGSLEEKVQSAAYRAEPLEGLQVVRQIALAVKAIHQLGYAHRDVKPANVLLTQDGIVLADFGLCLQAEDDAERLTGPDEAAGSRLYVAPENESGINEERDQRPADFYAFAKLSWAALAGRTPPAREQQRDQGQRLQDVLGDARYGVLDTLFDALLNINPHVRLQDWDVVMEELSAFERALRGAPADPTEALKRSLGEAARKIATAPAILAAAQAQSHSKRHSDWVQLLFHFLISANQGAIRRETDRLSAATGGGLWLGPGGGGAALVELAAVQSRILPEGLRADATVPSAPWGSSSAASWVIAPAEDLQLPWFNLGIYASLQPSGLYLIRTAWFKAPATRVFSVPDWIVDRSYAVVGPLPMYSAATLEAAADLAADTAQAFLPLANTYLTAVAAGGDPEDPQYWSRTGMDDFA